jgi:hypothetical protein
LYYVVRTLAGIAPSWSVELHEASAQEVSLFVLPEAADDDIGPTFIIRKDNAGFHLDQFRWDIYAELKTLESLSDLVADLRARLVRSVAMASPVSLLLH